MAAIPQWKIWQDGIHDYFAERQKREPLTVHRFEDTAAAGNYISAQPGDCMVVSNGSLLLIEAKWSGTHDSLTQCFSKAVSDKQMMFARLWARAGAYTFLAFAGKDNIIELWDSAHCARIRAEGRRLTGSKPIKTFVGGYEDGLDYLFSPLTIHTHDSYFQKTLIGERK